ncbi:uncharacterized protein BP5553_02124 [Venustampulla echinocandica]|uniref:Uncharacterized protein n=1 Tax=Venustampulla echinocandica TaxID=2656787 RepID=A0A370U2Z7_9HELO|nr:uncharacterized protein BP5553_02124 [Venustampulla echinocandica]RDL42145.1 hypothetical protein BP5553_02124 [Venustampulla echinocandica]
MSHNGQLENSYPQRPISVLVGGPEEHKTDEVPRFWMVGWQVDRVISALTLNARGDAVAEQDYGYGGDKIALKNVDVNVFRPLMHCVSVFHGTGSPMDRVEHNLVPFAELWLLGEGVLLPEFLDLAMKQLLGMVMKADVSDMKQLVNLVFDPSLVRNNRLDRLEDILVEKFSLYVPIKELFNYASELPHKLLVSVISYTRDMVGEDPENDLPPALELEPKDGASENPDLHVVVDVANHQAEVTP